MCNISARKNIEKKSRPDIDVRVFNVFHRAQIVRATCNREAVCPHIPLVVLSVYESPRARGHSRRGQDYIGPVDVLGARSKHPGEYVLEE